MAEAAEEEEGLFKANAVNEEDPERDRAAQVYSKLTQWTRRTPRRRKRVLLTVSKEWNFLLLHLLRVSLRNVVRRNSSSTPG